MVRVMPWAASTVYQIYPRSFADSDGDGVGDLRGIIGRLDYLHRLGVDVVWVSPFYVSPMVDNGYDIADYQSVDPLFGTLADVDELIAELHARDMKLVIDVVINHTSDQHPWFVESRSSTDNPKRDWYWWRPPRDGKALGEPGAEPTNWLGFFSEPVWEADEATGEYYLHLFAREQPDLNWENPAVRDALYAMLRWWLDRGVDGFRMDVINLVSKVLPLRDGEPIGLTGPDGAAYGNGFPLFTCGPRIHEFMAELHREVLAPYEAAGRDIMTVAETPGATTDDAVLFTDPARAEVDMVFQFEHMAVGRGASRFDPTGWTLPQLKAVMHRWQEALGTTGWNSLYWNNHDQPRVVSRFGSRRPEYREASAKALATALHLQRGTPYVYQGEELGMTNFPFTTVEQLNDVESRNYHALMIAAGSAQATIMDGLAEGSRDNARTPMQWDATAHAGFTTGTPWLPVNPNHVEVNAAAQVDDPESVFSWYAALIGLRRAEPVVARGDFVPLAAEHERLWGFLRRLDRYRLLVLVNVSDEALDVDLAALAAERDESGWSPRELVLGTHAGQDPAPAPERLRPWEAAIWWL